MTTQRELLNRKLDQGEEATLADHSICTQGRSPYTFSNNRLEVCRSVVFARIAHGIALFRTGFRHLQVMPSRFAKGFQNQSHFCETELKSFHRHGGQSVSRLNLGTTYERIRVMSSMGNAYLAGFFDLSTLRWALDE